MIGDCTGLIKFITNPVPCFCECFLSPWQQVSFPQTVVSQPTITIIKLYLILYFLTKEISTPKPFSLNLQTSVLSEIYFLTHTLRIKAKTQILNYISQKAIRCGLTLIGQCLLVATWPLPARLKQTSNSQMNNLCSKAIMRRKNFSKLLFGLFATVH